MANDFTGMRKVTIKNNVTGGTGTFTVFGPEKIGADGLVLPLEVNELTTSTFAGDTTSPNGTNIGTATLSLVPVSIDDLKNVWPTGYDTTTNSWGVPIGGCESSDCTLAFEKVCDTKGNIILRHCAIAAAFELALSRDDAMAIEVNVYPALAPGSEYGLTGDLADAMFPYRVYNGVYDPSTDTVTYDSVTPPSGE